ncbi:MAG: FHA domain-containing protein [Clostridium sp.]|nr:FHA domain-containing protein [Clostridium sp.]
MRTFNFKARNIGEEKYLTYTMGEECELDEDVLDYCDDNDVIELLDIIYEEDEDYDYLTYDITGRTSLAAYTQNEMSCGQVLNIIRNVSNSLVSLKEQTIHLSYIILNKNYIYIDEKCNLKLMCLPVENKGSVVAEFKSFIRQLLANMQYNVDEDLSYVGKLLTYINGSAFNLRGLVGLSEALMEEAGIEFEETDSTTADGVEVVASEGAKEAETEEKTDVADFMNSLDASDGALPEIGDDEEDEEPDEAPVDDEELDSILPAGMKIPEQDTAVEEMAQPVEEENVPEIKTIQDDVSDIKTIQDDNVPEIKTIQDDIPEIKTVPAEPVPEIKPAPTVKEAAPKAETGKKKAEKAKEAKTEEAKTKESKPEESKTEENKTEESKTDGGNKNKKETDVNLIKDRIKELVGEVPTAKTKADNGSIKTLEELDEFLESKPPVVKKNVVKVNRAALIQSAAEHESATEELTSEDNPAKAPANPTAAEATSAEAVSEKTDEKAEKPKSNSILSKTVEDVQKSNTLLNAPKVNPYLVRVNTDERIMINKATFKIGKATRGVDYTISGNGAVSRQHAIITQKNGVYYIKDNKSTNHTYVNGKIIMEGVEEILTHDSVIKLGDEEFQFKLK